MPCMLAVTFRCSGDKECAAVAFEEGANMTAGPGDDYLAGHGLCHVNLLGGRLLPAL